jgi:hypothetical protein
MLNDTDAWPVTCPECGKITKKQIGWLKNNTGFRCDGCQTNLWFHKETFVEALEQAKRTIDTLARTSRFAEKKP